MCTWPQKRQLQSSLSLSGGQRRGRIYLKFHLRAKRCSQRETAGDGKFLRALSPDPFARHAHSVLRAKRCACEIYIFCAGILLELFC